jgi:hypothetical protein
MMDIKIADDPSTTGFKFHMVRIQLIPSSLHRLVFQALGTVAPFIAGL